DVALLASPLLDVCEQPFEPGQPFAARRAPATGLTCEKLLEVLHHRDDARAVVEDDSRARAEEGVDRREGAEIERYVEVLVPEKARRGPARQHRPQAVAVLHPSHMLLDELARRRPERQLDAPRAPDAPARSVDLRARVLAARERSPPG